MSLEWPRDSVASPPAAVEFNCGDGIEVEVRSETQFEVNNIPDAEFTGTIAANTTANIIGANPPPSCRPTTQSDIDAANQGMN